MAASPVAADDESPCFAKGQTYEIAKCLAAARVQDEGELNHRYRTIMGVLAAADRLRLKKAQRAWVAYREATCDAEYRLWDGGTGGPLALLACLDREARRRTAELEQTYRLRLQRLER
ncbi:lysozyme inhibitor LprI family protein [Sphingomonas sp.]|uniref:lysozyme inhibitor LprI family protein n=1 Tax=Sphingomonas sp. TaxID=28214 RepID=UPI0025EDC14E|nr:lysozyme inhibitor LprI family protein [Sphingomonas sp.]